MGDADTVAGWQRSLATKIVPFLLESRDGGGLWNSGVLRLQSSTVSGNTATSTNSLVGGGLSNRGTLTLRTTIVAGNTAFSNVDQDCRGGSSRGYNLTGEGTGCPSDPTLGDVTVAPSRVFTKVLGLLQDNGGLTFTHALLTGSENPALDAIDPATCGGTDQRGVPRPQGAGCDIGAFELQVP